MESIRVCNLHREESFVRGAVSGSKEQEAEMWVSSDKLESGV